MINNYLSHIQEGMFISKEPLVHRLDEWKKSKNGKLFIMGASGSGKSTLGRELEKKYKCRLIVMDDFITVMESVLLKRNDPDLIKHKDDIDKSDYWQIVINKMFKYIINSKEKIIAEGFQSMWMPFDELKNHSIILLRTSNITSLFRVTKRVMKDIWESRFWKDIKGFENNMIKLKNSKLKESIYDPTMGGDTADLHSANSMDKKNSNSGTNKLDVTGNYLKSSQSLDKRVCIKKCDDLLDAHYKQRCIDKCEKKFYVRKTRYVGDNDPSFG